MIALDYLCAARIAPHHSWRNPVERMMSILNLGFQSIGLMRSEMSAEAESPLKNCKSLSLLRKEGQPYREEIAKSLEPTIQLLLLYLNLRKRNSNCTTAPLMNKLKDSGKSSKL